jgi:hypothetical protein
MSSRICTPSGSHIYGNGNLGIELNDGGLCGYKVLNAHICTPINLMKPRSKPGIVGDSLTMSDLFYMSVCHFGGTATVRSSRAR